jgi:divinyl chlorophyllide a 8-vinyl-reductase
MSSRDTFGDAGEPGSSTDRDTDTGNGLVPGSLRILLLGATGTTGTGVGRELARRGHRVVCFVRPRGDGEAVSLPFPCQIRTGDATDPSSLARDGFRGEYFDAVISCMASRTGAPDDAWAVDYMAHMTALVAARAAGAELFLQLSAICVQKPRLQFQRAKLAFEQALMNSGLNWSIIRPTAFFKSLSGQVERVRAGKPFMVFGDGTLTACKPIGVNDLSVFVADTVEDTTRWNRALAVGGPGPALTPLDHGALLAEAVGREPEYRHIPVAVLRAAVRVLSTLGAVLPPLRARAELARIGLYYATESMLVWDDRAEAYDADATPEFGQERLGDYFRRLVEGEILDERGDHALL